MANTVHEEPRSDTAHKSTSGLLSEVLAHVSGLVRGEMDLARAEMQEKVTKIAVAIGLLVGALILVLSALNVLSAALVAWIAELGLEVGWASLIVGGALALIGVIMVTSGKKKLEPASLAPTRSARNVRRDAEAVRDATDSRRHDEEMRNGR